MLWSFHFQHEIANFLFFPLLSPSSSAALVLCDVLSLTFVSACKRNSNLNTHVCWRGHTASLLCPFSSFSTEAYTLCSHRGHLHFGFGQISVFLSLSLSAVNRLCNLRFFFFFTIASSPPSIHKPLREEKNVSRRDSAITAHAA